MKLLILILILASILRFYGLNWDQNQHLHPDERFLTMVAQAIRWPEGISQYFDTAHSPLNPHNQGYNFFVYGTFPLFFTKLLADLFGLSDYNNFTLFGRAISALFDVGTVLLVFLIARKITSQSGALLAAFFYAISVLPIQLSHFFAVDTFLNFLLVAVIYFLITGLYSFKNWSALGAGVSFGLTLASKVTALGILPAILFILLYQLIKNPKKIVIMSGLFILGTVITFRLTQPYAFAGTSLLDLSLNPKFILNLQELQRYSQPDSYFPPAVQWNNTPPLLYPLKELFLWGMGPTSFILAALGFFLLSFRFLKKLPSIVKLRTVPSREEVSILAIITVIAVIFFYQGIQFAKPLRYFLPIFPFLSIIMAHSFFYLFSRLKRRVNPLPFYILHFTFYILIIIWPLAFISIYTQPHPRVQASQWIYQNIPPGSSLSADHWDDALPLGVGGRSWQQYQLIEFPIFGPDNPQKWTQMDNKLQEVDYVVLSSNRAYGSIMRVPKNYPQTSLYYQKLFDSSLGFVKVAEFTSRPRLYLPGVKWCLNLPGTDYGIIAQNTQECNQSGLSIVDDYIDETSTVYDHPKVIIFKKVQND